MKNLFYLLLTFVLVTSCKKESSSIENLKDGETIIYKIDSFNSITNNSIVNIEISDLVPKDEIHFISVKQNLDKIKREVINGNLIISNESENFTLKNNTQIFARVNSDQINKFRILGAGYIKSTLTQKADNITIEVGGAGSIELPIKSKSVTNLIDGLGNIELTGSCETIETTIAGAGNLNAFDLKTSESTNNIIGIGNANVNVANKLTVVISGLGNLTYKGNPSEIVKNITGIGRIQED